MKKIETRHKNKLILQPNDYIVFTGGLKIENVGDMVITMKLPSFFEVQLPDKFKLLDVKVSKN